MAPNLLHNHCEFRHSIRAVTLCNGTACKARELTDFVESPNVKIQASLDIDTTVSIAKHFCY